MLTNVVVSPDVMSAEFAESLPGSLSVFGWNHSHPHNTVHPSHVDLATQASYQTMNKNFVGLIFSVFNYDPKTGIDTREVAAFQSGKGGGSKQCLHKHSSPSGGKWR